MFIFMCLVLITSLIPNIQCVGNDILYSYLVIIYHIIKYLVKYRQILTEIFSNSATKAPLRVIFCAVDCGPIGSRFVGLKPVQPSFEAYQAGCSHHLRWE